MFSFEEEDLTTKRRLSVHISVDPRLLALAFCSGGASFVSLVMEISCLRRYKIIPPVSAFSQVIVRTSQLATRDSQVEA